MALCLWVPATLAWLASALSVQGGARSTSLSAQTGPAVSSAIDSYCAGCHNGRMRSPSGVLLSQLREDHDPLDLWSADYTFLNGQLATHYGVPNATGSQFRRVPLSTPARRGLHGHGSVLMVTSRHQHGVLLQHPEAFRTTIVEKLLAYASTGAVARPIGTPETLISARRILRSTPKLRWSALIAAVVQGR